MYTHTYNILNLSKTGSLYGESEVITKVNFDLTASDGRTTVYLPNKELNFGRPEVGSFVDFNNLTEDKIRSWITGSHPVDVIFHSEIAEKIKKKNNTIVSGSGLPWNS